MVWEGRDAVKTGRGMSLANALILQPSDIEQLSSVPPTPLHHNQAQYEGITPSKQAGISATVPIALRMPKRRLLSGSRRVRSKHTSPLCTNGSMRSREYNENGSGKGSGKGEW
jgi:hypothetical protein